MNCEEVEPLLPEVHTGKLSRALRSTVIFHCQTCEVCLQKAMTINRVILDCMPDKTARRMTERTTA
jgi:hypothetical protein